METKENIAVTPKNSTLTPKSIIHQNFGSKARYVVEEVTEVSQTECPGLNIPQKGPRLYRCTLHLPELTIFSGTFKKKKDAEQSAAEMAIEKLGIHSEINDLTPQEAHESLVARIAYLFSEKFLTSDHPLRGHIQAGLWRKGDLCGSVPIPAIAVYDTKIFNLCKCINPEVESNPFLVFLYIMKAATMLSGFLVTSEQHLWIRRQSPYPQDIIRSLMNEIGSQEIIEVAAVRIPGSVEKSIEAVTLYISLKEYYLDVIAKELGFVDAANVLISRNLGKSSSETRLFFAAPKSYLPDTSYKLPYGKETLDVKGSPNVRANYLSGQDICGDAILASIGYTRKNRDLFYEDVTARLYYRMLQGKTPDGIYKLSRDAMLMAELPSRFTTRANWRGSLPRDILCMFCRQHRLSEPLISVIVPPIQPLTESSGSCFKVSDSATNVIECVNGASVAASPKQSDSEVFKSEIKLLSRCEDVILMCSPMDCYKKQSDAIQNASLKLLLWINKYIKSIILLEQLHETADDINIQICSQDLLRKIFAGPSVHSDQLNAIYCNNVAESVCMNSSYDLTGNGVSSLKIEGPDSGICPCNGSLPCVSYSVYLVMEVEDMKEVIEVCNEFEFEVGVGAVISYVEEVVMQMSVGQYAHFTTNMPNSNLIFASADDSVRMQSLLSSKACCLEYEISLTKVTEPPEERMEQALFSPPLSKQRVEFAVQHIVESNATSLLDFGCGSGSLLEALLNYPTSLEKIAGIDISQKGLTRAAKVLNSKLDKNSNAGVKRTSLKSVILYEGSITAFSSRLYGFDIGTCLEVIEHMDEEQACLFGDVALRFFCPRILIVSTPNFEYNVVLQKSNPSTQEQEESDEKTLLQSCKFRNHDHKFEWTRVQFQNWASDLAARHNYSVEFSGVGGSADVEPGFASQIAVFKRDWKPDDDVLKHAGIEKNYNVIWEWNSENR